MMQGAFFLPCSNRSRTRLAPTPTNNNYDAVNGGQLKGVAKPFYAFLIANGYATNYPWAASTNAPDDYAMANIGQAKYLFSFDPAAFPAPPTSSSH